MERRSRASHGLRASGANMNIQNQTGNTAAHFANAYGYVDVYALLVDSGADLTIRNDAGKTAPENVKGTKMGS